ncbi:MAG: Crp/Fnr family transcriptional regulator [Deltaproteobacteria bacterium]|nr:Crp/Fnr family transcriptional regulator [Deltaproteobacteria bacterium]
MADTESKRAALIRHVAAGQFVFREGETGSDMYVVRSGRIRICQQIGETDLTLALLGPGETFGEMALLEQQTRSASAVATEESDLVVVREDAFEQMLKERPDIAVRLLKKLSARLREANRQVQLLTAHGSAARVVDTLRSWVPAGAQGEVLLRGVTPDRLWRATGTPREVFGEIIHRLGEAGVACFSGDGLHIRLPQGLDDYLEYLDLKRAFDPATAQQLAALTERNQPSDVGRPDPQPAAAVAESERRTTYQRFLALKQRFEK